MKLEGSTKPNTEGYIARVPLQLNPSPDADNSRKNRAEHSTLSGMPGPFAPSAIIYVSVVKGSVIPQFRKLPGNNTTRSIGCQEHKNSFDEH